MSVDLTHLENGRWRISGSWGCGYWPDGTGDEFTPADVIVDYDSGDATINVAVVDDTMENGERWLGCVPLSVIAAALVGPPEGDGDG